MLDLAAKLDSTAEFLCKRQWGDIEFPAPFGRDALPEVHTIRRQCISLLCFRRPTLLILMLRVVHRSSSLCSIPEVVSGPW